MNTAKLFQPLTGLFVFGLSQGVQKRLAGHPSQCRPVAALHDLYQRELRPQWSRDWGTHSSVSEKLSFIAFFFHVFMLCDSRNYLHLKSDLSNIWKVMLTRQQMAWDSQSFYFPPLVPMNMQCLRQAQTFAQTVCGSPLSIGRQSSRSWPTSLPSMTASWAYQPSCIPSTSRGRDKTE